MARKSPSKTKTPAKGQASLRTFKPVNHTRIRKEKTYKQVKVPGTNKKIDRQIPAKPVGWRKSESGRKYFENRENRSDTDKERKYHGRATQKPEERKKTKTTSRTTTRGQGTTRRAAGIRKHDKQKPVRVFDLPQLSPSVKSLEVISNQKKSGNLTSQPSDKKTKKLSLKELRAVVAKYENEIRTKKTEHGLSFDEYGNVIYHASDGKKNKVYTPIEYKIAARIFTHNHPSGSPFSWADIANLLDPEHETICSEIHAVAPDGTIYILIRRPDSERLSRDKVKLSYGKKVVDRIIDVVLNEEAKKYGLTCHIKRRTLHYQIDARIPDSLAKSNCALASEKAYSGYRDRICGELEKGLKIWAKEHNLTYLKSHV